MAIVGERRRADRPRLSGIEALRGAAAVSVVLYHVARHLDRASSAPSLAHAIQFGHAGVDLFFVISGFIILMIHRSDIGRPRCWRRYAARRFSRIFPTYWVALALTLLLPVAGGHALPSVGDVLRSMTLLPSSKEPSLGVAWTLQYEITFYALFCCLILNRRMGVAVFAAWLGGICLNAAHVLPWAKFLPPQLTDLYGIEFFFGMAVASWYSRSIIPQPRLTLAVGLLLFILSAAGENAGLLDGYAPPARIAYGVPSALIVLGVVAAERAGQLEVRSWLRALGEGSYSIYLFQFVFIGVVWKIWVAAGLAAAAPLAVSFPALAGAAVFGGIAISRVVEPRLARLLRPPQDAASRPAKARLAG